MEAQSDKTENQILAAAKIEFAQKGYDGARIGAIAKRAGVNQALIHYYFSNKETLYRKVVMNLMNLEKSPLVHDCISNMNLTPPEHLYLVISIILMIHQQKSDPDFDRILAREIAEDRHGIRDLIREYFIPRLSAIETIIQKGIETGDFETPNPLLMVINIIVQIISYYSNRELYRGTDIYPRLYESITDEDFSSFIITTVFKSLTPPGKKVTIPVLKPELLKEAREEAVKAGVIIDE